MKTRRNVRLRKGTSLRFQWRKCFSVASISPDNLHSHMTSHIATIYQFSENELQQQFVKSSRAEFISSFTIHRRFLPPYLHSIESYAYDTESFVIIMRDAFSLFIRIHADEQKKFRLFHSHLAPRVIRKRQKDLCSWCACSRVQTPEPRRALKSYYAIASAADYIRWKWNSKHLQKLTFFSRKFSSVLPLKVIKRNNRQTFKTFSSTHPCRWLARVQLQMMEKKTHYTNGNWKCFRLVSLRLDLLY